MDDYDDVRALKAGGDYDGAIRRLRERTGWDLATAKRLVDELPGGSEAAWIPPSVPSRAGWIVPLAWAFLLLNLVAAALEAHTGRLLEAARTLTYSFGLALCLGLRFGLPANVAPIAGLCLLVVYLALLALRWMGPA